MTGGEIVPAAKLAASVARKAVKDSGDKAALQKLAEDSPSMKAAAESYARRVAIKEAVLLKAYQPLARFLGISREYFDTQFHSDLAAKVADIPDDKVTTPAPSVAIPAMQGLGYSIGEPELKEMYLNLLATATDSRVADEAHPSFAQIINQLAPREAKLLLDTLLIDSLPAARLFIRAETGEGEGTALNYLLPLVNDDLETPMEEPAIAVWVDNWIRLGLIEVDYTRAFVAKDQYEWVSKRPEFLRHVEADRRGAEGFRVENGVLRTTDFGKRFRAAVTYEGVSLAEAPGVMAPGPGGEPGAASS